MALRPATAVLPAAPRREGRARSAPFGVPRHAALLAAAATVVIGLVVAAALYVVHLALLDAWRSVPPAVARVDVPRLFVDTTPVRVVTHIDWRSLEIETTADALTRDHTVWQRLWVGDWDTAPRDVREQAFDAMLRRYRQVMVDPRTWDAMTADDWDRMPQPVRALAFKHMAQYWTGHYRLGADFGIPAGLMGETVAAIIMAESWFEHRAVNVNPWGNRDLGVAQASDSAREAMRQWFADGRVEFLLDERQYFNPWYGSRFVAVWMRQLLEDTDGDLEAAIRGYHKGARRALRGEGDEYLEMVLRRRRVLHDLTGDSAWPSLLRRDRELLRTSWPWLRTPASRGGAAELWRPRIPSRPALFMQQTPVLG